MKPRTALYALCALVIAACTTSAPYPCDLSDCSEPEDGGADTSVPRDATPSPDDGSADADSTRDADTSSDAGEDGDAADAQVGD